MKLFFLKLIINLKYSSQISFLFGVLTLPFGILDSWFFENIDYIRLSLGCVAVDHFLGTIVHTKFFKNDWDFKKNYVGLAVKISMVISMAFLMEALAHVTIEDELIYRYLRMVGRLIVIIYPILSAMKNMKIITKGAFPPDAIVGKLENFNKDLSLKNLKEKEDKELEN